MEGWKGERKGGYPLHTTATEKHHVGTVSHVHSSRGVCDGLGTAMTSSLASPARTRQTLVVDKKRGKRWEGRCMRRGEMMNAMDG